MILYLLCFREQFVLPQVSQGSWYSWKKILAFYVATKRNRYFSDSKYPNCVLSSHRLCKPGALASPLHPSAPHIKI